MDVALKNYVKIKTIVTFHNNYTTFIKRKQNQSLQRTKQFKMGRQRRIRQGCQH